MKAVLALLLGLISHSWADDDSVVLEFESAESAEQTDDSVSYGGIIIQVRQGTDEAPTIALGSDIDSYDDVYCLNFVGLFEASDYDTTTTTSGDYTEIDDTRIDLADANCTTFQEDEAGTTFTIQCNNAGDATLRLTFTFIQDEAGDYGLEYIINLQDYEFSDASAKLVMVQSLSECGDLIDLDDDETDEEESTTTPEPTETEEPEETEPTDTEEPETTSVRRRLLQETSSTEEPEETEPTETEETEEPDTETEEESDESTDAESLEEEDGISEDDSGEFDTGFARFVVNGQALDVCDEGSTMIDSTLVYQPDDGELHIVFNSFECTLVLDPFLGLDVSKYQLTYADNGATGTPSTTEDNAQSFGIIIASFIGLFVYLW